MLSLKFQVQSFLFQVRIVTNCGRNFRQYNFATIQLLISSTIQLFNNRTTQPNNNPLCTSFLACCFRAVVYILCIFFCPFVYILLIPQKAFRKYTRIHLQFFLFYFSFENFAQEFLNIRLTGKTCTMLLKPMLIASKKATIRKKMDKNKKSKDIISKTLISFHL